MKRNLSKVTANRRQYKIKKDFFVFIVEMQRNLFKVTANRRQYKIKKEFFVFIVETFTIYFYTIYLAISSEMLKFAAIFENIMADSAKTEQQFKDVLTECRTLFQKKLHDYGASWRILRPSSLTDQLYIKAKRIRSLEIKKESLVGEGIRPEFIALINYGIVGIIQLEKGYVDEVDITSEEALQLYDKYALEALQLMTRKNHDYDEAWRSMRVSSYTDFILTKIQRVKEIEDIQGDTLVSEGIDANYMDIINYAVFGVIKMSEE